jgi:hypothetical protein
LVLFIFAILQALLQPVFSAPLSGSFLRLRIHFSSLLLTYHISRLFTFSHKYFKSDLNKYFSHFQPNDLLNHPKSWTTKLLPVIILEGTGKAEEY